MRRPSVGQLFDLGIFAVVLFVVFRPEGPGGQQISAWYQTWHLQREARRHWQTLTHVHSIVGEADSAVSVIEFMDYQCPGCRSAAASVDSLAKSGRATAIRHFPLSRIHPQAREAALASICSERVGAFKSYHELLLSTDDWEHLGNWGTLAVQAGIRDTLSFKRCMRSPGALRRLRADSSLAEELGIRTAPTFVGYGHVEVGAAPGRTLQALMEFVVPASTSHAAPGSTK